MLYEFIIITLLLVSTYWLYYMFYLTRSVRAELDLIHSMLVRLEGAHNKKDVDSLYFQHSQEVDTLMQTLLTGFDKLLYNQHPLRYLKQNKSKLQEHYAAKVDKLPAEHNNYVKLIADKMQTLQSVLDKLS